MPIHEENGDVVLTDNEDSELRFEAGVEDGECVVSAANQTTMLFLNAKAEDLAAWCRRTLQELDKA